MRRVVEVEVGFFKDEWLKGGFVELDGKENEKSSCL